MRSLKQLLDEYLQRLADAVDDAYEVDDPGTE